MLLYFAGDTFLGIIYMYLSTKLLVKLVSLLEVSQLFGNIPLTFSALLTVVNTVHREFFSPFYFHSFCTLVQGQNYNWQNIIVCLGLYIAL